jgi:NADP-reducing hydrogenase subunit HndB
MKSVAELEEIQKKAFAQLNIRKNKDGIKIVVGMATCGIAAGARPVMTAMLEELNKRNMHDVSVIMTGCKGNCKLEPIVEIISKDGSKVTYVNMTPQKAVKVIEEHIANGKVCAEYIAK